MTWYDNLTHPGTFVLDAICATYLRTLDPDQILDLSPSVYWKINWFKFDATCSQISALFADDEPLSEFYDLFDDDICPLQSSPGNERNITSAEEPPPGWEYNLFDYVFIPSELDLFFDFPLGVSVQLAWFVIPYKTHSLHRLCI